MSLDKEAQLSVRVIGLSMDDVNPLDFDSITLSKNSAQGKSHMMNNTRAKITRNAIEPLSHAVDFVLGLKCT